MAELIKTLLSLTLLIGAVIAIVKVVGLGTLSLIFLGLAAFLLWAYLSRPRYVDENGNPVE